MQSREKGFTLIELIVVIAIIGILAAIVVPNLFSLTDQAKEASTKAMASALVAGMWANFAENGEFPVSDDTDKITAVIESYEGWEAVVQADRNVFFRNEEWNPEGNVLYAIIVYSDKDRFIVNYTTTGRMNCIFAGGDFDLYDEDAAWSLNESVVGQ